MLQVAPLLLLPLLVLHLAPDCQAAPPANDNFVNRSPLSGEDLLLDVDLAEATIERQEVGPGGAFRMEPLADPTLRFCVDPGTSPLASRWWTWTAPRTGTVVVRRDQVDARDPSNECGAILAVWREKDSPLDSWPLQVSPVIQPVGVCEHGQFIPRYSFAGFTAEAGETYLLQVVGYQSGHPRYRLSMPRGPQILESPVNRTLLAGETSFLHVVALGSPFPDQGMEGPSVKYQWLRNGIELPGETFASILLPHVQEAQAGEYRVKVTDLEGSVTSAVAHVTLVAAEAPPTLSLHCDAGLGAGSSGGPCWVLTGEPGRYYAIESSTNLHSWAWQPVQALSPLGVEAMVSCDFLGSTEAAHVLIKGAPFQFRANSRASTLYLRARRVQPPDVDRHALLWIITYAKEEFARDPRLHANGTTIVSATDIAWRIHPDLVHKALGGETDCRASIILGVVSSVPQWPCVPVQPEEWNDPYWFRTPGPVWNPAE
ncbi:MAG TPA: hypothetical protein DCM86_19185 [Verrucomicrobiales bacterium]|nr:hypothetical protein [Verrucomicrobiales bacterium]